MARFLTFQNYDRFQKKLKTPAPAESRIQMPGVLAFVSRGRIFEVSDTSYWHLAKRDYWIFFHNVRLDEGICPTASFVAQLPGLENVVSPYFLLQVDRDKERAFEEIRGREYSHCPSRNKAFFLFDSFEMANHEQRNWFGKEGRVVLEARIVAGSQHHRGDAAWLDAKAEEWKANARRYWAGEMTANPQPEVIVHGLVYFPTWKTFPRLAAP